MGEMYERRRKTHLVCASYRVTWFLDCRHKTEYAHGGLGLRGKSGGWKVACTAVELENMKNMLKIVSQQDRTVVLVGSAL